MKATLTQAKLNKEDEFYTQLSEIEKELKHYKHHFKDKVVYCNADDPRVSDFFHYFSYNFEHLGLKKLITTCYKNQQMDFFSKNDTDKAIYLEYEGEKDGGKVPTVENIGINHLEGDGDFRSQECIDLLKEADIVVTNPPFSLFREYVGQLVEHDKKFLIIGSFNAITYKEIFQLIREDKIWLGFNNGDMAFKVPDYFEPRATRYWEDENGQKWRSMGNVSWYTNLDISKRHEDLILYKNFTPEEYSNYDNYNAINVDRTNDIPIDYDGIMGVPITFLNKHNPEQFEVLGMTKTPICYDNEEEAKRTKVYENVIQYSKSGKQSSGNKINDGPALVVDNVPKNKTYYKEEGKNDTLIAPYARILIRNKKVVE